MMGKQVPALTADAGKLRTQASGISQALMEGSSQPSERCMRHLEVHANIFHSVAELVGY